MQQIPTGPHTPPAAPCSKAKVQCVQGGGVGVGGGAKDGCGNMQGANMPDHKREGGCIAGGLLLSVMHVNKVREAQELHPFSSPFLPSALKNANPSSPVSPQLL